MSSPQRPLSPHLQIYRPQLTSVLSILHRISGVVLSMGTLLLVAWLWSVGQGAASYDRFQGFMGSGFGRILLFGWSMAFFYHLCNGIRHLFWDMGKGFEIQTVYRSGWLVVAVALALNLAVWIAAYAARGSL